MNNEKFSRLKNLSLEIQALIGQGVRDGIGERIEQRNTLLQEWFSEMNDLINVTNEQQIFLEGLLKQEQDMLQGLEEEQQELKNEMRSRRKLTQYQHIADS